MLRRRGVTAQVSRDGARGVAAYVGIAERLFDPDGDRRSRPPGLDQHGAAPRATRGRRRVPRQPPTDGPGDRRARDGSRRARSPAGPASASRAGGAVRVERDPRARGAPAAAGRGRDRRRAASGARVAEADLEAIKGAYVARRLVEPYAAQRASLRISGARLDALDALIERMAQAHAAGDGAAASEANHAFHFGIYARCGCPPSPGASATSGWRTRGTSCTCCAIRRARSPSTRDRRRRARRGPAAHRGRRSARTSRAAIASSSCTSTAAPATIPSTSTRTDRGHRRTGAHHGPRRQPRRHAPDTVRGHPALRAPRALRAAARHADLHRERDRLLDRAAPGRRRHHVLFDSGLTEMVLLHNLRALGDPRTSDVAVLSHGHPDHFGGPARSAGVAPGAAARRDPPRRVPAQVLHGRAGRDRHAHQPRARPRPPGARGSADRRRAGVRAARPGRPRHGSDRADGRPSSPRSRCGTAARRASSWSATAGSRTTTPRSTTRRWW